MRIVEEYIPARYLRLTKLHGRRLFREGGNEGFVPGDIQADYETMELTTGRHPMYLVRARLPGLCSAAELAGTRDGALVKVGGAVITRQRPGTAKGFCFITLEDETGHINAIVRPQLFETLRMTINLESALIVAGRLQNEDGVIHVMAEQIEPMPSVGLPAQASHDFH